MKTDKQEFSDQIEIESIWLATEQGKFVFFALLLITSLLVIGLWDTVPKDFLIAWFLSMLIITSFKWGALNFYRTHKHVLIAKISQAKYIFLLCATLTGLCWTMGVILFLIPSEPTNVLIISIALIIEVTGIMLIWFSYLPIVLVTMLPPALTLVAFLFLQGDRVYIATSGLLFLLTMCGIIASLKLAKTLNYALHMNFENAALRQESEEKSMLLQTALENMSQGISMADKDDRLRMWNSHFIRIVGSDKTKIEKNTSLASVLSQATPPINIQSARNTEYHLPDGQVFEIRQSLLTHGGRVLTFTNISDLVKREQALEKALKDAEQANAAKTRFLAAASHDLRQPIHALGLFFADLSERVHSSETALVISQIADSISTINSMLNALLDISKLDAGVVKPTLEVCALSEIFTRLEAEFQSISKENHNKLHFRSTVAIVKSDPAMLERILRNLIGNALRYTRNGCVLVAARLRKENVEIQVLDNGLGIPENQLDEIFIEFHQLQNSARDRRQGLGLGLAIVKRLANLLQHEVKVISCLERGSRFSVVLPVISMTMDEQEQFKKQRVAIYHQTLSLKGLQVLLVDDDTVVLEAMKGLLSHWGCDVLTANSSTDALSKLSALKQKLDLLIIDYRLPENVSGIDIARDLQAYLSYPLAVLIITGDTGPDRLQQAEASGYPLLHKPVQPGKLRSTLQYLVAKQKSRAI